MAEGSVQNYPHFVMNELRATSEFTNINGAAILKKQFVTSVTPL